MKFFIRTVASPIIGFGHIFRCLSLAKELVKTSTSFDIQFIINNDVHAKKIVSSKGYDYVVIDDCDNEESFLLSKSLIAERGVFIFDTPTPYNNHFISTLSKFNRTVMIQCYSEARFYADLSIYPAAHLDATFLQDLRWVDCNARLIYGFEYCLLNEKIKNHKPREIINTPPRILSVVAGGADPTSSLLTISNWLKDFSGLDVKIYCQYGLGADYKNRVRALNFQGQIEFCEFSLDLCAKSDLVICAFGVTVYELTYLRIPMLTYGHTQKHTDASQRYSERFGCSFHLGLLDEIKKEQFLMNLEAIFYDSNTLKNMQSKAKNLVDGAGVKRVSNLIAELSYELR